MGEAALAYAARDWCVFPVYETAARGHCACGRDCGRDAGKHPRWHREDLRHGLKDATRKPDVICRWWTRWPDANIAVRTGDGLLVVDVDGPEGEAALAALEARYGTLPPTRTQRTGREGGRHLFFTSAFGHTIGSRSLGPGLDLKADGGYVVVAPSRHASGRQYTWLSDCAAVPLPPSWQDAPTGAAPA
jgi:hypothetical protein